MALLLNPFIPFNTKKPFLLKLIKQEAKINYITKNGFTALSALLLGSTDQKIKIADFLISQGAKIQSGILYKTLSDFYGLNKKDIIDNIKFLKKHNFDIQKEIKKYDILVLNENRILNIDEKSEIFEELFKDVKIGQKQYLY